MTDAGRLTRLFHAAGHCLRRLSAFLAVPALYFGGLVAAAMFASLVYSPYPRHAPETSWAELRFVESLEIVGLLTIAVFIAMVVGGALNKMRGCRGDLRFYPVPHRIRASFRSGLPRTVLAVELLTILGYLAARFTAPRLLGHRQYGPFWPAECIFICLVWTWSAMWLAETLVRPSRPAILAAMIFSISSLLIGLAPRMLPSTAMGSANASTMTVRSVSDLIYLLGSKIEHRRMNVRRIPRWAARTTETEHFIYFHSKGDQPDPASLEAHERHYEFCDRIFPDMPQQILFVKHTNEAWRDSYSPNVGGLGGMGYVHSRFWFHPHEAVHSYQRSRNLFLHEGIAEAFGTSFYYFWGDVCDKDFEMSIHDLYDGMDRVLGRSRTDRVVACNFVRWLFHRHGPAKMVIALREAYVEGSRTRAVLARVYGVPFEDFAAQWQRDQEWLRVQKPPEGFFAEPPWDREAPAPVSGAATREP